MATPDGDELVQAFQRSQALMLRALRGRLERDGERLYALRKRLRSPADRLRERAQHLDHLEIRLVRAWNARLAAYRARFEGLLRRFSLLHPERKLAEHRQSLATLQRRLESGIHRELDQREQHLRGLAATLNAVSPLATLERGYAIASDDEGQILRSVDAVQAGDPLQVRLHDGRLDCRVEERHRQETVAGSRDAGND